jgi:hypothetical protein
MQFPADIFTEPDNVSPDTLANLGWRVCGRPIKAWM